MYSINTYSGSGVLAPYAVTFPYLSKDHVEVRIGGVLQTSGFSWLGSSSIGLTAPAGTNNIDIRRNTPAFVPDVVFNDGSTLTDSDLNLEVLQLLYVAQETADAITDTNSRTIHFPTGEVNTSGGLPPIGDRASTLLGFDSLGNVIVRPLTASVGAGDMRTDMFTAGVDFVGGTTATLTLSRAPGTVANVQAFFDAAFQGPDAILSVVGTTLTFTSPIPAGVSHVYVRQGTTLSIGSPSASSVLDSAIAPGSALYDRVFNVVSVEDAPFNASPSAVDNWAAIQAAVTFAIASGKSLRVPRKYNLSKQVTGTGSLMLFGFGMDLSGFNWPAGSASYGFAVTLSLTAASLSSTAGATDLCFSTGAAALGNALSFKGAANTSADRITPRVNINRVLVRGATNPVVDGFANGLVFDNCTGVVVEQYNFWGKVGTGGQPNYDSLSAIDYNNNSGGSPHPTELAVSHSIINICKTGINTNDYEGALIHDNQIVGVNAGVRLGTPGPGYPHADIHDNHINADAVCVAVQGMYEVFIHHNLLYNQLSLTPGTAVSVSSGSQFVKVDNNIFENYNQSVAMTGVTFDNCQWSMAQGNIFRRCDSIDGTQHGVGVWMTANSANCKSIAHDQMFIETLTAHLNSGTNNTLVA